MLVAVEQPGAGGPAVPGQDGGIDLGPHRHVQGVALCDAPLVRAGAQLGVKGELFPAVDGCHEGAPVAVNVTCILARG